MNSPKIIEFSGLPRSGKTTSAKGLKSFLESLGKKTYLVKERASLCPIKNKLHPDFNLWTSLSFLREYLVAKNNGCDFVIADRGLFDAMIWINLFIESDDNYTIENNIFQELFNSDLIDKENYLIFFFDCDIEISLKREYDRTLIKKNGTIMNKNILKQYINSYSQIKSRVTYKIDEINTSTLCITDMLNAVYNNFKQP